MAGEEYHRHPPTPVVVRPRWKVRPRKVISRVPAATVRIRTALRPSSTGARPLPSIFRMSFDHVGNVVCSSMTPPTGNGALNWMTRGYVVSVPASISACRSEPAPLSAVLVTLKVAACESRGSVKARTTGQGQKRRMYTLRKFDDETEKQETAPKPDRARASSRLRSCEPGVDVAREPGRQEAGPAASTPGESAIAPRHMRDDATKPPTLPRMTSHDATPAAARPALDDPGLRALMDLFYGDLRRIARRERFRAGAGATLCTTALVNEAWLKLQRTPPGRISGISWRPPPWRYGRYW